MFSSSLFLLRFYSIPITQLHCRRVVTYFNNLISQTNLLLYFISDQKFCNNVTSLLSGNRKQIKPSPKLEMSFRNWPYNFWVSLILIQD